MVYMYVRIYICVRTICMLMVFACVVNIYPVSLIYMECVCVLYTYITMYIFRIYL